ncbi:hypothetical protein AKO1_013212 [Acrasis kona]|uniref:BAH domain-containing protein n=1 Tax=Acrasis kona TaxID=1008807 RepID=A0AAW2YYK2_9EUKA
MIEDETDKENNKFIFKCAKDKRIPIFNKEYLIDSLIAQKKRPEAEYINYSTISSPVQPPVIQETSQENTTTNSDSSLTSSQEQEKYIIEPQTPKTSRTAIRQGYADTPIHLSPTMNTPFMKRIQNQMSAKKTVPKSAKKPSAAPAKQVEVPSWLDQTGDHWLGEPKPNPNGAIHYNAFARIGEHSSVCEYWLLDTVIIQDENKKAVGVINELYETNGQDNKKMVKWTKFYSHRAVSQSSSEKISNSKLYLSDQSSVCELECVLRKAEVFSSGKSVRPSYYCENEIRDGDIGTPFKIEPSAQKLLWNVPGESSRQKQIDCPNGATKKRIVQATPKEGVALAKLSNKFQWCDVISKTENEVKMYSNCIVGGIFLQLYSCVRIVTKNKKKAVLGRVTEMKEKVSSNRSILYVEIYEVDPDQKDGRCLEKCGADSINVGDISSVDNIIILSKQNYDVLLSNNKKNKDALNDVYYTFA